MSTILAFDSSGGTASVCLRQNGQTVYEEFLAEGLTHSETLLPLLERALRASSLSLSQLSALALTVGPGSFTGLRIGLALAKGLALPHQLPLLAVSTLEALAHTCTQHGLILAALNARRGEVYWASFRRNNDLERLTKDAAGSIEQALDFIKSQKESVFYIGDGAKLCYNMNGYTLAVSGLDEMPFLARGVAEAAEIAYREGLSECAANVSLQYLRLSQAERERLEKSGKKTEIMLT